MYRNTLLNKKQAQELVKRVGKDFTSNFTINNLNTVDLRSKTPCVCWKSQGLVSFAAVSEYAGPNTMEADTPLLLKLRVNEMPPPALFYHSKSPAVKYKLGLINEPTIATTPAVEIISAPEELVAIGKWLPVWFEARLARFASCASPPIALYDRGWSDAGEERLTDFNTLGQRWPTSVYLWTKQAILSFDEWLKTLED